MELPWGTPSFEIADMIGQTFSKVDNIGGTDLVFTKDNGDKYVFHHSQNCCEHVYIEDIVGDLSDLEKSPILEAECISNCGVDENEYGTFTWTYYKFGTIKGCVNVRWYGSSNGYYSESVDQSLISKKEKVEDPHADWI